MKYEFVEIPGFPSYEINCLGLIRNLRNNKIMLGSKVEYPIVALKDDYGKRFCKSVHILVAQMFVPNPNSLPIVHHINENKQDPFYKNLRWGTYQDNTNWHYLNRKDCRPTACYFYNLSVGEKAIIPNGNYTQARSVINEYRKKGQRFEIVDYDGNEITIIRNK